MSPVAILFGTESGNAEMVADDLANALEHNGIKGEVLGMADYVVDRLPGQETVIVITSTYGDGDLPETTEPFYRALTDAKPDLSGIRFAAFGLGDSTYDTYNRGIRTVSAALNSLGATQIGETGFHDAASGLDPSEVALDWLAQVPVPQPQV
jgi:MioC protein